MSVNSVKQDELIRDVPKKETLARLYKYLLAYKRKLVTVALLLSVTLSVTLITPLMIELAVDTYVAHSDIPGLFRLGVTGFSLFLLYMLCRRGWMRIMADITNQVLMTIRSELYRHIQSLSFHFLDRKSVV